MNTLKNFTNLYQLSKTLRFELIPQGKTLDFIEKNGLLSQDEHRAESYKKVKKLIDEFHKKFIDEALGNCAVKNQSEDKKDSLEEFFLYYKLPQQDEARKSNLPKIQENLRKQIVKAFTSDSRFTRLDKKELIKEDLLNFVVNADDKELVNEFKDFTTYFTGFHENRKNMYSAEEKSTAISYRLINENLPRFIDNMSVFEKVKASPINESFTKLQTELESIIQVVAIDDMFLLSAFNETLTQTDIDRYNHLIGGYTSDDGKTKIQGLNEYINLYNQTVKNKNERLPKFKPLYKQILSDRVTASFIPEQFENDQNVLDSLVGFYAVIQSDIFLRKEDKERTLKELLEKLSEYDLNAIYLKNDTSLTNISKKLFGDWSAIQKAVENDFELNNPRKKNEKEEKYEERKTKYLKSFDSFSIGYLNQCVATLNLEKPTKIESYFSLLGKDKENNDDVFSIIEAQYNNVEQLLNTPYPESKNLSQQKHDVEKIKAFLDAFKELQRFIKPLLGKGDEADKDNSFYGEFIPMWDALDENLTPLYNKVRNYMTRKPYSTEKIRLFFKNKGQFLGGWVDSKTENSDNGTQAGGYLFRKRNAIQEYDYYLGISTDAKLFRSDKCNTSFEKSEYERLDYYQLKTQSIYGSSYQGGEYAKDKEALISSIDQFVKKSTHELLKLDIENERAKKKPKVETPSGYLNLIKIKHGEAYIELLKDEDFICHNNLVVERLKNTLKSLKRIPAAEVFSKKDYSLFTEIIEDIDMLSNEKVFSYFPINQSELDKSISCKNKPLLLFKITNKDLSFADSFISGKRKSRGIENLHTLYFKALMGGHQNVLDIGTGMVFHREQTIKDENRTIHLADHPIENKNENNKKKQSLFSYDIIKNKRYTKKHHFQFHLSIILNYQKPKTYSYFNDFINQFIKENHEDIHIIGIDRGERHLLYLTLIDAQGKIKEQYSLNEIVNTYKGTEYKTNYHDLLDKKEGDRDEARKNWQTIETIKELKEGYLSQVIHKITTLMTKYNAIVVLEDLNMGFMRGRQKVEKSVYQKFEKMLIDKLNYLADKQKNADEPGGLLHAYQLTNKFESFQKMGKQSGFLFYVPAWNTSKMDPVTGFVNLFDTRYENMEKSKAFFQKFDAIRFNKKKNYFEFSFDYNKFTTRAEGSKTNWTVCTYGNRIENFRNPEQNNEWDSREFDLTKEMKSLFEKYGIDLHSDLKEAIEKQSEKSFFQNDGKEKNDKQKGLLQLFRFALQMRNSKIKSEVDYLISPVANEKSEFYDSRTASDSLPKNADANGAYNIARKGLWVIEQIQNAEDLKKVKLAISNKEWLQFAQK